MKLLPLLLASVAFGAIGLAQQRDPAAASEPAAAGTPPKILSQLEADGNGLYDDTERAALLEVFLQECPDLREILAASAAPVRKAATTNPEDFEQNAKPGEKAAAEAAKTPGPTATAQPHPFDQDGDGKVSIAEQSQSRPPLSLLVPKRIVASPNRIPWTIDIFPEWISSAYLQEDLTPGAVAKHSPRGTILVDAEQADPALQPQKSEARGGVEFAADSGKHFSMRGHRAARWDYRWCIFTFRVDGSSGKDDETVLLDLNQGNGSNRSSPRISYHKTTGLNVQYVGLNKGGLDRRIMKSAAGVVADGKAWNVLVCGIRYGRMFASLNGVDLSASASQPDRFSGDWIQDPVTTTYVGSSKRQGNMAWAYDALVFGLTEPSEAMVQKMTGWAAHRLGFPTRLPEGHPYRERRPVLDLEDFPARYLHDDAKWNAWGQSLTKDKTRVNAGGLRVEPEGFETVFLDDFRAPRARASTSGEGEIWMGPGFNTAVGIDAPLVTPGRKPDTYPFDAEGGKQTLSLVHDGKGWRGSALYTVNDLGHGYAWKGPKIFRVRCMFPKVDQKELAKGLFPAFWSYSPDSLVWRTANRIEVDWFEFDGKNGKYLNGLATHLHYPYIKTNNIFAVNTGSYKRFKAYGGELDEAKSKIPGGLYIWDGQFHTWEWVVDAEMTYANVTITGADGREKWVEIFRCPTAPTYLESLDLQFDYALKAKDGVPKNGERQDFVVDWVEVQQKVSALQVAPAPFQGLPQLSGSTAAGGTVKCAANLEGCSDIRYYWFADAYPLGWGASDSYRITEAEAGKQIRCMVKAVGARDMPEAWSSVLK